MGSKMKILTSLPEEKTARYEMVLTPTEEQHKRISDNHVALYCDKKCPSGPRGGGWLNSDSDCAECDFNPYKMDHDGICVFANEGDRRTGHAVKCSECEVLSCEYQPQ